MADVVQSAAPAASNTPATSAETPVNNTESADLDAAEAAEEASASENEGKVATKQAKPAKKDEKAIEKRIKKLKLKVDGREFEEDFDMDDEDRLIRELQMSRVGQKRAQEKSDLEKQVKSFFEAFDKDPFAAMKELGKNPDELIGKYIDQQMENAKKSPEQVAKEQLERELQALKSEREREREELKGRELTRLQEQAFQQYDVQMEQALSKSDLPKTPYTVKKMADYMLVALQAGYDVTPEDVAGIVREEMHSDLKEMFASLPEEVVEGLLGDQVLNKLRKRRVSRAQEAQKLIGKPNVSDVGKTGKVDAKKPGEQKTFKDFFGI